MDKKKKVIFLVSICLVILIGALIADKIMSNSYFNKITYEEVLKKIDNKEDLVLLISQTSCSHCATYKPKLERTANKYKVNVYYIDVDLLDEDEYNNLNSKLSFSSSGTPLTIFLKNGNETTVANRIKGDSSVEKIVKKLKSNGFISE